ncbi:PepSY domain-containing protein [Cupriavidus sp. AU9028]|uniref:PepSY-associated TM helix domain-containing protein n=1 Tax=Cupriavidus sp. AU9028 TaxID=2871157 RepID=UPI001C95C22F|nr:PepSY-associated TM helix domain-containing protein [Cupriavidus sp. AU9028]MBY4899284.1 PepSY domain-containing protein [Cupriavidus sp. AU9028]
MVTGYLRVLLARLHLYIGLGFGLLFVLLGLTGAALVWREEIDVALNPDLLLASAPIDVPVSPMHVQAVTRVLEGDPRYGRPKLLMLPLSGQDVFVAWYALRADSHPTPVLMKGKGKAMSFEGTRARQVMIDPVTLAVKGERIWGQAGLSRPLLMPTLFHLHHYLLAGEAGRVLLGVASLLLLVGVLAGVVLWWLPRAPDTAAPVRPERLHRRAGIVAAPVLLLIAFTGWYLNLPRWVTPLVGGVMEVAPPVAPPKAPAPGAGTPIEPEQAMQRAQALFPDGAVTRVAFPKRSAPAYEIRLRQPDEVRQGEGATRVWLDAFSGELLAVRDPLNAPEGDRLLYWMYPLHTGEAFGMPGRAAVSCLGAVPLLFAVTGALVWWNRRRLARARQRA